LRELSRKELVRVSRRSTIAGAVKLDETGSRTWRPSGVFS
jgi:hypothetical protein